MHYLYLYYCTSYAVRSAITATGELQLYRVVKKASILYVSSVHLTR